MLRYSLPNQGLHLDELHDAVGGMSLRLQLC